MPFLGLILVLIWFPISLTASREVIITMILMP